MRVVRLLAISGSLRSRSANTEALLAAARLAPEGVEINVLDTSPHSVHARASLIEVLATMGTRLVAEASVVIPIRGRHLDADAILQDPELSSTLRKGLATFLRAIESAGGATLAR